MVMPVMRRNSKAWACPRMASNGSTGACSHIQIHPWLVHEGLRIGMIFALMLPTLNGGTSAKEGVSFRACGLTHGQDNIHARDIIEATSFVAQHSPS